MATQLDLGDVTVAVSFKDIKNVHLSVFPPTGNVRISAPSHMTLDTVRVFAISKLDWIRQQQKKLQGQERETPREYLDRESHYVWGKRYLLHVSEADNAPSLEVERGRLLLTVRAGTGVGRRQAILERWYRDQLRKALPPLIGRWEPLMSVKVGRFFVQSMKTKWGSCNHTTGNIRLNTELAKKPRESLEYVVVHEMVHLVEPTHNAHFVRLMDKFMPGWRVRRDQLNQLPVSHAEWAY